MHTYVPTKNIEIREEKIIFILRIIVVNVRYSKTCRYLKINKVDTRQSKKDVLLYPDVEGGQEVRGSRDDMLELHVGQLPVAIHVCFLDHLEQYTND